jgi:ubiquinone/menaquinone biosynthesis C-methylase UbiE
MNGLVQLIPSRKPSPEPSRPSSPEVPDLAREPIDSDVASAIAVYDAMPIEYDNVTDPYYRYLQERFNRILALELPAPCKVLDLGCGTGWQAIPLLARGFDVTCVDLSRALLRVARSKAESLVDSRRPGNRTGPITFLHNDIRELPLASATFDAVYSLGSVLSHLEDPLPALHEMHRVLKNGGRVILEFENLYNLDLLYMALDAILCRSRAYGLDLRALGRALRARTELRFQVPIKIDDGRTATLQFFKSTSAHRRSWLSTSRLIPARTYGLHVTTQIVPPRIQAYHSHRLLQRAVSELARIDDLSWLRPELNRFSNTVVVVAEKR